MPASDIVWNASQSPVFQVYGTKRKSSFGQTGCQSPEVALETSAGCKRRCMQRGEPEGVEINHNDPELHSLQHCHSSPAQDQSMDEDMEGCGPAQPQTYFVQSYYGGPQIQHVQPSQPPVDQYPAHRTSENNMVMDLCDETYFVMPNKCESSELEAAQSRMDSDFTPNQQQYTNSPLAYCDPNCICRRQIVDRPDIPYQ